MQVELRQGLIADCQSFWKGRRRSFRRRAAAMVSVCGKLGRAGRVGSRALRHTGTTQAHRQTGTTQAEAHLGKALPTQRLLSLARVGLCSPRAPVNQVDPASWHRPPATCDRSGDQKWRLTHRRSRMVCFQRCCCCVNLRTGGLMMGVMTLALSAFSIVPMALSLSKRFEAAVTRM